MKCSSCDYEMGTSKVCSSCGRDHRTRKIRKPIPTPTAKKVRKVVQQPDETVRRVAIKRPPTESKIEQSCDSCGFQLKASKICPSCGFDNRENKTEQAANVTQSVPYSPHCGNKYSYSSVEIRFLRRWLSILFWILILSLAGSIMNEFQKIDLLVKAGQITFIVASLGYIVILFRLSKVIESYSTAGKFYIGATILSLGLILWAYNSEMNYFIFIFFTVLIYFIQFFGIYNECEGHSFVICDIDRQLSFQWTLLWKWYLGLYSALFAVVILPIFSRNFSLTIAFLSRIGLIIAGIVKIILVSNTAVSFNNIKARQYQGNDVSASKR